jgi:two-component system, NarL family, nitrate/nitrite response regulator NarL
MFPHRKSSAIARRKTPGIHMRVLIVDDHSLFCDGLKLLLRTLGVATHVTTCMHADQARVEMQGQDWDLVLLDWNLGAQSPGGARLIADLKCAQPQARVVVVSAEASARHVREAVEAGAVGFVPKEASSDLLIDAIRVTSHGGIYLPASVLDLVSEEAAAQPASGALAGASLREAYPNLTPRQIDVLVCMLKDQSNKQIARSLGISDGTVKQHLNAVYRELEVKTRTGAVCLLARQGIKVF